MARTSRLAISLVSIRKTKPKDISPARLTAFEVLRGVEKGGFSSTLLASTEPQLEPLDRALCHELVMGVLRWQLYLDKVVEHFSGRTANSLDAPVRLALRLGLYQLRFLSRIPASAAVNESVNLVQHARLSSARTFVNAVLRRATREPEYDPASNISDSLERISVATSHPGWLIKRWSDSFGNEETEALAKANNEPPPIAFRVIRANAEQSALLTKLSGEGAGLESSDIAAGAWRVTGATKAVRELVERGQIYIQDEASQLVAQLLDVQKGDRILDVCAAPGGKTTLIADRAGNDGFVVASDLSTSRILTLANTVERQQLKNTSFVVVDAEQSLPFQQGYFDRVLVDAPCSGSGTLRGNPEIRWRLSPADFSLQAKRQLRILRNAAQVLRPGGRLIYSTCSVEREENEDVVIEFLDNAPEFRSVQVDSALATSSGFVRTSPQRDNTDGFFVAMLEKLDAL